MLIECSTNNIHAVNSSTQEEGSNSSTSQNTDSTSKDSAGFLSPINSGKLQAHNPEKSEGNDDTIIPIQTKRTPFYDYGDEQIAKSPVSNSDSLLYNGICYDETPILNDNDEKETCCVAMSNSQNVNENNGQMSEKDIRKAQEKFETYLHCYMYKFKEHINSSNDYKKEIANLNFRDGESNLDLKLREYLSEKILNFFKDFKKSGDMIVNYNGKEHKLTEEEIGNMSMDEVIAPSEKTELPEYIKGKCQLLKTNARRYVNVDILMVLKREKLYGYVPIEVKSVTDKSRKKRKDFTIPGSSVNQIIPNGWLIFVKHPQDKNDFEKVEVAISKYGLAMKSMTPVVKFNPSVSFELAQKAWKSKGEKIILNDEVTSSSTSGILSESDNKIKVIIKGLLEKYKTDSNECTPSLNENTLVSVSSSVSVGTGCSPIIKSSSPRKYESNLKLLIKKVLAETLKELAKHGEEDIMKILSNCMNPSSQFDWD